MHGRPPLAAPVVHLLVLNHNGRHLLERCLPSVVEAAAASRHCCRVAVVDNQSDDGSTDWLAGRFPEVDIVRRPNRGLCSFNDVVPDLPGPVAILLNNDVVLDRGAVDPLVEPFLGLPRSRESGCFMTAPLCWRSDGVTYEGLKTAVQWRWGLVQATARFPGHATAIYLPDWTASAGAVMAVDCRKFVELGGFDPLYLPGRLEDLDFAFRGYLAGYHARYVPQSIAWHLGMATFSALFGEAGCDALALRNTLLFQWKNLRHPGHIAAPTGWLPVRLAWEILCAAWTSPERRWPLLRALRDAMWCLAHMRRPRAQGRKPLGNLGALRREREFFRRFHPRRLMACTAPAAPGASVPRLPSFSHAVPNQP